VASTGGLTAAGFARCFQSDAAVSVCTVPSMCDCRTVKLGRRPNPSSKVEGAHPQQTMGSRERRKLPRGDRDGAPAVLYNLNAKDALWWHVAILH